MRPVEAVLDKLEGVQPNGDGHVARCPCPDHGKGRGDRNPSFSIKEGDDGRVLLKCFAGCGNESIVEALGLQMSDLFDRRDDEGEGGGYTSPKLGSTDQPCTLESYAALKRLPVSFLKGLGLKECHRLGEKAVSMPYLDASGENVLLVRSRVSLTGKPKVMTRKGDKHHLYGLCKLEEAREAGYLILVEGESDAQTLWYHGEPAAGVPGASSWKAEWVPELAGIDKIYMVVEDEAGEGLWRKLAATAEVRERLYKVELEGVKDVSDLHVQDPKGFNECLHAALRNARAWLDIAESEQQERAREAWAACQELAESEDILAELVSDLERCRLVGEERNAKLLYLALTTRLLQRIVSVAVKGPSSGGKSHLVKAVLGFFPGSAYCPFTAMSEKTLIYTEEPLEHRFIVLYEAAGLGGDFQEYLIRSLLSEGRIDYETVEKTTEGMQPRRIRKDGPTGFVTTTTRDRLHAENETRYLSLTVEDTREQTRRVFRTLAEEATEEPDLERWHALQVWLESAEHRVVIPYAGVLAEKAETFAVRLRRDFSVILSLIKAHAVLHQASRERDAEGRVVATLEDYARVRDLVADLIAEGIEVTVPETVRETVEAVRSLINDGPTQKEHATVKEVARKLSVDKAAASRRVRTAINRGHLVNNEEGRGRPAKLVMGEAMPKDAEVLPTVAQVEAGLSGCAVDRDSEGIKHPLPPSFDHTGSGPGEGAYSPFRTASTDQPETTGA
jgi:hypothetical protein